MLTSTSLFGGTADVGRLRVHVGGDVALGRGGADVRDVDDVVIAERAVASLGANADARRRRVGQRLRRRRGVRDGQGRPRLIATTPYTMRSVLMVSLFARFLAGCQLAEGLAQRGDVPGADPGHGRERFVRRHLDRRDRPQVQEQRLLRGRPDARNTVELGAQAPDLAQALAGAVREPVRLVAQAGQEEERGRRGLRSGMGFF